MSQQQLHALKDCPQNAALRAPYLLFVGDEQLPAFAKTGLGIVQWCRQLVAGQLRLNGDAIDLGVPDMDIASAVAAGARSLIIGVAPVGGTIPESWWQAIVEAAEAGLDIVSGLHYRLVEHRELVSAAAAVGARLVDVRIPPPNIPVGSGKKRSGKRVLMVGTDCVVGKKYSALALHAALRDAGVKATFRATGQTGIMIAGEGIPVDSVVADFISGAAELLTPNNEADHWDVIEGQGSLFHPGYSGVSLGLLHGSQPDAFVVCHDAARTTVTGWPHYTLPGIAECIDLHKVLGRRTNPDIRCAGVSVNTSGLPAGERADYLRQLAVATGLPCVDPLVEGCAAIAEQLKNAG